MELNGVLLEIEKWKHLGDDLLEQKDQLEKALHDEFGQFNLESTPYLLKTLHAKGIDIPNTSSGPTDRTPRTPSHRVAESDQQKGAGFQFRRKP